MCFKLICALLLAVASNEGALTPAVRQYFFHQGIPRPHHDLGQEGGAWSPCFQEEHGVVPYSVR